MKNQITNTIETDRKVRDQIASGKRYFGLFTHQHTTGQLLKNWIKAKPNTILIDCVNIKGTDKEKGDIDYILIIGNIVVLINCKNWKEKSKYSINPEFEITWANKPFPGGAVNSIDIEHSWKNHLKDYDLLFSTIFCITSDEVFIERCVNWWRAPFRLTSLKTIEDFLNDAWESIDEENKTYINLDLIATVVNSIKPYDPELEELVNSEDWEKRAEAAEQGYGLEKLIDDEHSVVRLSVAKQGYGLEKLVNDENDLVRHVVAQQGFGLEQLVNDKYWEVRETVAKHGYGLKILVNDEINWVRKEVAKQGYALEKLIDDEDEYVRKAVAEQGYGLDKLVYDKNASVREMAKEILKKNKEKFKTENYIKASQYAEIMGIHYNTVIRNFHKGSIEGFQDHITKTIYIKNPLKESKDLVKTPFYEGVLKPITSVQLNKNAHIQTMFFKIAKDEQIKEYEEILRFAEHLMHRRYRKMEEEDVNDYMDLSDTSEHIPFVILLDRLGDSLVFPAFKKGEYHKAEKAFYKTIDENPKLDECSTILNSLSRLGRAAGVHMSVFIYKR